MSDEALKARIAALRYEWSHSRNVVPTETELRELLSLLEAIIDRLPPPPLPTKGT